MSQISNFESADKGRNVSNKTWLIVIKILKIYKFIFSKLNFFGGRGGHHQNGILVKCLIQAMYCISYLLE